jgi:hypothetical protein
VTQICEVTENTKRGARGFILPVSMVLGNPPENTLLPITTSELERLGLRPRGVALDGGFQNRLTDEALTGLAPKRVFIAGRQQPASRRTQRRLARTEPAPKAASATSNAATDSTNPGSKANTGHAPGTPGRSPPTTLTPSPSEPTETIQQLDQSEIHLPGTAAFTIDAAVLVPQPFIRGK